jgi:lysine-N-methylase
MRLFAPHYYGSFKCIADKCTHSCCIGWEIDIDEATSFKYSMLSGGYGINIRNSIDHTDTPHFRLCENERCPHLSDSGLCNIITELSEDFLCDICREHPRFYNFTSRGKEVGIGMSCEEACRIILTSDEYNDFTEFGTEEGEPEQFEFDAIAERERIYTVLSDRSIPYTERLAALYNRYDASPALLSDIEWRNVIDSLEFLDGSHKELFLKFTSDTPVAKEIEPFLERTLAYFVFRHCSDACDNADFLARLGFCLFCERLMASIINAEDVKQLHDTIRLSRIVSEEIEYAEDNTESIVWEFGFKQSLNAID